MTNKPNGIHIHNGGWLCYHCNKWAEYKDDIKHDSDCPVAHHTNPSNCTDCKRLEQRIAELEKALEPFKNLAPYYDNYPPYQILITAYYADGLKPSCSLHVYDLLNAAAALRGDNKDG